MSLLALPRDILVLLPDFLHNIEDYTNLSSTCRSLRSCLSSSTSSKTILRLAAAQSKIFFRPSPHFLVAATARELGFWARESDENETQLATKMEEGMEALLELALEHCGLTIERLRELHRLRFEIVNPVTNIIDQCVGEQWYAVENFWNGGRSDAYTISAEPSETFFHLAIYGELFGPDFEALFNPASTTKCLKVDTRLEYIKYCLPDFATEQGRFAQWTTNDVDPRRIVKPTGPYKADSNGKFPDMMLNHNLALTWVWMSSRWRPHWKAFRQAVGCEDFVEDLDDGWWFQEASEEPQAWRQRLLEGVMACQGMEGLGMVSPGLSEEERVEKWGPKVREWREAIAASEAEPETVTIEKQATMVYPYLLGDLRVCAGGYVMGT